MENDIKSEFLNNSNDTSYVIAEIFSSKQPEALLEELRKEDGIVIDAQKIIYPIEYIASKEMFDYYHVQSFEQLLIERENYNIKGQVSEDINSHRSEDMPHNLSPEGIKIFSDEPIQDQYKELLENLRNSASEVLLHAPDLKWNHDETTEKNSENDRVFSSAIEEESFPQYCTYEDMSETGL